MGSGSNSSLREDTHKNKFFLVMLCYILFILIKTKFTHNYDISLQRFNLYHKVQYISIVFKNLKIKK